MPRYKILSSGRVIIAEKSFMDAHYPDGYEKEETPSITSPKELLFKHIISGLPAAKRKALWAAKASNADVEDFLEMIALNGSGRVTDQWVIDGVAACVSAGILSSAQADKLLED